MAGVVWKGRMQEVQPGIYLDGAHNLSGIEGFLEAVKQITKESAVLLFSMVKEKDYTHAARKLVLEGNWEEIVVTAVSNVRGVSCQALAELFEGFAREGQRQVKVTGISDVREAYEYALSCRKPKQKLFCAGSLYLIGELEQITGGMQND